MSAILDTIAVLSPLTHPHHPTYLIYSMVVSHQSSDIISRLKKRAKERQADSRDNLSYCLILSNYSKQIDCRFSADK